MPLQNAFANLAVEAKQDTIITALAALLTELGQKLETGGAVALDAGTLAALESITAVVSGTVALDSSTLAALETINAVVSGEVALNAATLAALETINAAVTGTVAVSNHPSEFPLPSAQILTLTPQTNALTDGQLRASAIPVSAASLPLPSGAGTEATLAAMLAEFRNKYDVVQTAKATYTTSGDHTLITPPGGQALRVVWLFAQAKGALDTGVVLITITLGSNSYDFELTGSQPFAHGAVWEGSVDQVLTVNTSNTAAVIVNADYRVF